MHQIRADQRRIVFQSDPEGIREVQALCHTIHGAQLQLAKVLERLHRSGAFLAEQCGSVQELAAREGLPHGQGRKLRYVGHAIQALDWVEGYLQRGKIDFERAAALGRLMDYEGALQEGDEWKHWAVDWSLTRIRSEVSRRIEEATQKQRLVSFHAWITENAKKDFDRAQTLASRKKQKKLTRGAAFGAIVEDYVQRHDPQEKTPGKRRIGDTASPDCRTVPAEVEHEIRKQCGDRCCVPACEEDVYVEIAHDKANRNGGDQEVGNVHVLCHTHHVMFDAGEMWIIGTGSTGLPVFETKDGKILHPDFPNRVMRKSKDQPSERGTAPTIESEPPDLPPRPPEPPPDAVRESGLAFNGEPPETRSYGVANGGALGGASMSADHGRGTRHGKPFRASPASARRIERSVRAPPG